MADSDTQTMDEMEQATNEYENEAETTSDFVSGMEDTLESEASNLK